MCIKCTHFQEKYIATIGSTLSLLWCDKILRHSVNLNVSILCEDFLTIIFPYNVP